MKKLKYSSIPKELHLIVTGEHGKGVSFSFQRDKVPIILGVTLFIILFLGIGTWKGIIFFQQKNIYSAQADSVTCELTDLRKNFDSKVKAKVDVDDADWNRKMNALAATLRSRTSNVAVLKEEKQVLITRYEQQIAATQLENGEKITALSIKYEEQIAGILEEYHSDVATLEQEKQAKQELLERIVSRLDERSQIIESMMSRIGVKVKKEQRVANSGGPFIAIDEAYSNRLLDRSDQYIETIKKMPLGYPVTGKITSGYGRRSDPFVRKEAFHGGIDFKGRTGDKIEATADGTVIKSSYNKGLGHYVTLRHGNGYETVFGHMSKRLVKKGDKVQRGQVVGLVGNTGRSTGSHLHYEVRYRGKTVNPGKFLSVAKLSFTVPQ